jgi:hypothetical protein
MEKLSVASSTTLSAKKQKREKGKEENMSIKRKEESATLCSRLLAKLELELWLLLLATFRWTRTHRARGSRSTVALSRMSRRHGTDSAHRCRVGFLFDRAHAVPASERTNTCAGRKCSVDFRAGEKVAITAAAGLRAAAC